MQGLTACMDSMQISHLGLGCGRHNSGDHDQLAHTPSLRADPRVKQSDPVNVQIHMMVAAWPLTARSRMLLLLLCTSGMELLSMTWTVGTS